MESRPRQKQSEMLKNPTSPIDHLISTLQLEISDLNNALSMAQNRKKFLHKQVLTQFAKIDVDICKRVLTKSADELSAINDHVVNFLTHNEKATEKFTNNFLTLQPSVIEQRGENDIGKLWHIEGKVGDIQYLLQFSTEFKNLNHETIEIVAQIDRLEFLPQMPYLIDMSKALKAEPRIETIVSSLCILKSMKNERNEVLQELNKYQEVMIDIDDENDSVIFHVFLTSHHEIVISCSFVYNSSCANFFHQISVKAEEETLIRFSQHSSISVLKGEKSLKLENIIDFIGSLFTYEEED